MNKTISIIIVTYNSDDLILDCLKSIYTNNDIGDKLEVIVVDNMSKNVESMFSKIFEIYGNKVTLIKNSRNGGYGQGNNVGINASTAPIIMIMNPDVRLISPIFNKVNMHFSDPTVAMLGMRQMVSHSKQGNSFSYYDLTFPFYNLFINKLTNKLQIYNQQKMYIEGAAFFIRKNIFEEIGLFDENLFMYGEEKDVHYRLMKYNKPIEIVYDKSLKYIHLVENRTFSTKQFRDIIQSDLILCDKYKIDKNYYLKKRFKIEKAFIFIESIRCNQNKRQFHKEMVEYLSELKKSL
ncbi:MAG: glycosyltransferase family 2 protein [Bacteroidota bacterium]